MSFYSLRFCPLSNFCSGKTCPHYINVEMADMRYLMKGIISLKDILWTDALFLNVHHKLCACGSAIGTGRNIFWLLKVHEITMDENALYALRSNPVYVPVCIPMLLRKKGLDFVYAILCEVNPFYDTQTTLSILLSCISEFVPKIVCFF